MNHNQMIEKILRSKGPILLAFSGGKDSVAMVLYLIFVLKVPRRRIILHHHDVDGGTKKKTFDWACTESYCKKFADAFGLKILFSYRRGGIVRAIYRKNEPNQPVFFQREQGGPYIETKVRETALNTMLKFPAVSKDLSTRWCSAKVKIEVLRCVIANNPDYAEGEIFYLTGERREEGAVNSKTGVPSGRAAYEEIEINNACTTKKRTVWNWRPIIDWTEGRVWSIMREFKVCPHPAYFLGWNRCSCQLCIFGDANIWATINLISPEKIDELAGIETDIHHTLYNKVDIRQKVEQGTPIADLDPYWVKQALGEFTAPIIVMGQWQTPRGAFQGHRQSAGAA